MAHLRTRFPRSRSAQAALLAAAACCAAAEPAPGTGAGQGAADTNGGKAPLVLHPNPQSLFDGLRHRFVNVGAGNPTFQRRDLVDARARVVFARLHDSRIGDNADFGPGWRLALAEEVRMDGDGAVHVDAAGVARRYRASPGGAERVFERREGTDRFLLRRVSGPRGATRLRYRRGLLRRVVDGDGEVFRISRRADGRIVSVADRHGRSVEYGYDGAGRLTDVRDLAGNIWWHEYDAANRLTAALDPNGEPLLRASHDRRGRVVRLDDGRAHVFEYAPGRTVARGEDGGERVFEQDAAGATRAHLAPGGVAWRVSFDARHRVTSLALSRAAWPRGGKPGTGAAAGDFGVAWAGSIGFRHDDQGRVVAWDGREFGGQVREYAYDGGRLAAIAMPEGVVAFTYGARSVVVAPPAPAPTFEYHRAPSGRIVSAGYGGELIAVDWNESGEVAAFHADGHSAFLGRDAQGRVVQVRRVGHPDTRYVRDALGFVARVEHAGGATLRLGRDALGNRNAVERFGPDGSLHRSSRSTEAMAASVNAPLREAAVLDVERLAEPKLGDEATPELLGVPPARTQPMHGSIAFDDALAPVPLDPARQHVPGLARALRLFKAGAAFLSARDATTIFGAASTPPEYRPDSG